MLPDRYSFIVIRLYTIETIILCDFEVHKINVQNLFLKLLILNLANPNLFNRM